MTSLKEETTYLPLYDGEALEETRKSNCIEISKRHYGILIITLTISCLLNVYHIATTWTSISTDSNTSRLPTLYSPAQSVLRPTIRKFSAAFGLPPAEAIYIQPPSAEVDRAWNDLYDTSLAITRAEAKQLPNKTIPLQSGPDSPFLTGLNVFHDLHCLDSIRKALWVGNSDQKDNHNSSVDGLRGHHKQMPQTTMADPSILAAYRAEMHDASHLMHCINGLRESIMCHSDVTPLSWQYVPKAKDVKVFSDVAHTCRDFDAVRQWARERVYTAGIDESGWVDGRPEELGRCGTKEEGCGWD